MNDLVNGFAMGVLFCMIINLIADIISFKPSEEIKKSAEAVRICPRCDTTNTKDFPDCYVCGYSEKS